MAPAKPPGFAPAFKRGKSIQQHGKVQVWVAQLALQQLKIQSQAPTKQISFRSCNHFIFSC